VPTWLVVSNVLNSFTSLHNNKRVVGLMRFTPMQTKFIVIFCLKAIERERAINFLQCFFFAGFTGLPSQEQVDIIFPYATNGRNGHPGFKKIWLVVWNMFYFSIYWE
jgi:hypothetical protein